MDSTYFYLERSDRKHHKFYESLLLEKSVTITYGRIGRSGRTKIIHFPTLLEALEFFQNQLHHKIKRGYQSSIKGQTLPRTKKLNFEQLLIPFL